jgi:hypothetical protein
MGGSSPRRRRRQLPNATRSFVGTSTRGIVATWCTPRPYSRDDCVMRDLQYDGSFAGRGGIREAPRARGRLPPRLVCFRRGRPGVDVARRRGRMARRERRRDVAIHPGGARSTPSIRPATSGLIRRAGGADRALFRLVSKNPSPSVLWRFGHGGA